MNFVLKSVRGRLSEKYKSSNPRAIFPCTSFVTVWKYLNFTLEWFGSHIVNFWNFLSCEFAHVLSIFDLFTEYNYMWLHSIYYWGTCRSKFGPGLLTHRIFFKDFEKIEVLWRFRKGHDFVRALKTTPKYIFVMN